MIKFKKHYNVKIISIFVAVFIAGGISATYAVNQPVKSHIRVPLDTQEAERRLEESIEREFLVIESERPSVMPFRTRYLRQLLTEAKRLIGQAEAAEKEREINEARRLYEYAKINCGIIIEMANDVMHHADAVDEHRVVLIVGATEYSKIAEQALLRLRAVNLGTPVNAIWNPRSLQTRACP